ncbi:MAG: phosphoenolpyruvate--protein phosphotransferase [Alphaproteobacteria bacterium]
MPQVLLRRLREIMAARASAHDRLSRVVRVVAANLVAEVCSVYVLKADGLVLTATHGLNQQAVGRTCLSVGEGLVGQIARSAQAMNVPDAQQDPQFAYRPETSEDRYRSLMGVPILRAGYTLGVLVVQNEVHRHYTDEEVELLQTVAMVLAEVVASLEGSQGESPGTARLEGRPLRIKGLGLADGIAVGVAVLHEPRVRVTRLIAEDVNAELARMESAVSDLRASLDRMITGPGVSLPGPSRDILETYRMFAYDRGWIDRLGEAVHSGLTAEAAVERVQNDLRARMLRQRDPYIRERLHDLDDLANRLLRHLAGRPKTAAGDDLPAEAVIVARAMGPADLFDYDRDKLRGLILEEGSPNAHVAIVARALDIPLVSQCGDIVDICETGDAIVVDGDRGEVHIRPDASVLESYAERRAFKRAEEAQFSALRHEPAVTQDGQAVTLRMNGGLIVDLPHLGETGAQGIGLFRTELQFMVSATMPKWSAQKALYREVIEAAGDKPVLFRTLDLGGDKVLPYGPRESEENPALGWRAVRISLDRPALLRYQLRALISAAEGRSLHVMFPMVAEVAEFIRARELVDMEVERAQRVGQAMPRSIRVGTMLEVPSLTWQLDALLPIVDFISVGSNDLLQFMFACDRGNSRLAGRYDPLCPAMLNFLRHLVRKCRSHDVDLSLCGEMAGDPLEAMALIGLGFRSISMPPSRIGPVKVMVRSLHASRLAHLMDQWIDLPDHTVRPYLKIFAHDHGVAV